MRVLIASAPHADTFGYSMPPPGLLRLGGALEAVGHEAVLEDLAHRQASGELGGLEELADGALAVLARHAPFDVLGLSVMGATLPIALEIATRARTRWPDCPILFGGPGTTGVDAALVERFDCVDLVVRGEGERTLPDVLDALAAGRSPAGIDGTTGRAASGTVVRAPDRAPLRDLNELPPPAWHLLPPIAAYKAITGESDGLVPIDSGRGCVYDCSFCTIGRFWSRRSRPLPAARLVEEVLAVETIEAGKQAYLCHDLFAADRTHALEFCDRMIEKGARVPWECRARIDHLDAQLCERMAAAGCYRVLLGIESTVPAVRARNQKGMAADVDLAARVDACLGAGITPILSLILGLPGEGEAELRANLDACARLATRGAIHFSLHLVNPQPGCGLGEEFGERARAIDGIPPDMAFGTGESAVERAWIDAHPDLFSTYALLPLPEAELRELAALANCLPSLWMRFPSSFAALSRARELDVLDLSRAHDYDLARLEAELAASEEGAARALYAWESAQDRLSRAEFDGAREWRVERFDAPFELRALRAAARGGGPWPEPAAGVTHYAVVRAGADSPGGAARIRTHRVGADLARLLDELDGGGPLDELDALDPAWRGALAALGVDAVSPAEATPDSGSHR